MIVLFTLFAGKMNTIIINENIPNKIKTIILTAWDDKNRKEIDNNNFTITMNLKILYLYYICG